MTLAYGLAPYGGTAGTAGAAPAGYAGTVTVDVGVRGDLRVALPPVPLAGTVTADVGVGGRVRLNSRYLQGTSSADVGVFGLLRVVLGGLRGRVSAPADVRGTLALRVPLYGRVTVAASTRGDLRAPTWRTLFARPVSVDVGTRAELRLTAAPPNDLFAAAISLGSEDTGEVDGTNAGAGVEPGEPPSLSSSVTGATVWWTWTAAASGNTTFATVAPFRVAIDIFTGSSVEALTPVAGSTSDVTFPAVAGTTYYVRAGLDHFTEQTGPFRLGWTLTREVSPVVELASWSSDASQRLRADVDPRGVLRVLVAVVPPPRRLDPTHPPHLPDTPESIARREARIRVHRRAYTYMPRGSA